MAFQGGTGSFKPVSLAVPQRWVIWFRIIVLLDPSVQPGRRPTGANRRKYSTGSSPGVVLAGGTGTLVLEPH